MIGKTYLGNYEQTNLLRHLRIRFLMTKPKYEIGDRFTVYKIEYEIIRSINASEPAYIFQNCQYPSLKSVLTEKELDVVMANQSA